MDLRSTAAADSKADPFYPAAAAVTASSPAGSTAAKVAATIKRKINDGGAEVLTVEKRPSSGNSAILRIKITTPKCLRAAADTLRKYPEGIQELSLDFAPHMTLDETLLQTVLELALNLTSLSIRGYGLNISGHCFTALTQLTKLLLLGLPQLNDTTLQQLFIRNPGLTHLSLIECDGVTGSCFQSPSSWTSLTSLSLCNMPVSDASLSPIMAQAARLRTILLFGCHSLTGQFIRDTDSLRLLELSEVQLLDLTTFRNEGLQGLLRRAANLQTLIALDCPQISQIADLRVSLPLPKLALVDLELVELEPASLAYFLGQLRPEQPVEVTLTACTKILASPDVLPPEASSLITVYQYDTPESSDASSYEADDEG